ncbi:hypothetical protein D0864_04551 [Hortaea werneckii]|uniref:DUF423 domain-containing protein n=1 Tax=Hortaea werneckii TaxID=91943 RepID=A0A3M7GAA9_HORWE|nr:hypothetical protein D0863_14806 [Hortaea werneckii]RMY91750.1 hypothetical protein D0862_09664 [Hortaea werneckii]RMY98003.1 hypothetical protein D0864_04551 [Hortaea werneckii]
MEVGFSLIRKSTTPAIKAVVSSLHHLVEPAVSYLTLFIMAFWMTGCLYGASSVMLGAFGAHGLKSRISDPARIANWGTAAHYQLIHSVALLVAEQAAPKNIWAKSLFTVGMTMFSGSIYCLVLDPQRFKFMGPVTPLGGVCLIGGWVALAFGSRGRVKL